MISIEGRVAKGRTVEEYEQVLADALEEFDHMKPEELERMQNKIESMDVFEKTTVLNRAMSLAIYDGLGDANLINTQADAYRTLTMQQVLDAKQRYLRPEHCSTLYYLSTQA
jgi:zinc protease